jgi:hypothetical protein
MLNSVLPEHSQFFLNSGLFGIMYPWIPWVYLCISTEITLRSNQKDLKIATM